MRHTLKHNGTAAPATGQWGTGMEQLPVLAAILASPQGRAVLAAGKPGKAVRLFRLERGWSQQELANRAGWSQSTISRIEDGKTRAAYDMEVLAALSRILDIPPTALGLAAASDQSRTLDDVDRREVLGSSIALAVAALLPHGVTTAGRITAADVTQCWTALRRLHELDAAQGGATVYQMAASMARRLEDALRGGSYPAPVGRELRQVTAETMEQAGWLAYDAGWEQQARQWWLETSHLATLGDVPQARIRALASMALQAGQRPGGGPEAVELAQAATTVAKDSGGTPKLLSLLAAREAIGHAQAGDTAAAVSSVARARHWLGQGEQSVDPFWLGFYGPADLAWHETLVGATTRNAKLAETSARAAFASVDATQFPRNQVLYTVRLGSVLTQVGRLDEAINVTSRAVHGVHTISGSGRTVADLRRTIDLLGRQNYPPARSFATAAHRLLPAVA
ncbi:MAG TPA: helix-turn-helix transcriptional regulator [Pseudonocardiaceae bacterium]|nr:helix-turn-helix transcriptional regulator [Pseudonocardiaceae bacterium]